MTIRLQRRTKMSFMLGVKEKPLLADNVLEKLFTPVGRILIDENKKVCGIWLKLSLLPDYAVRFVKLDNDGNDLNGCKVDASVMVQYNPDYEWIRYTHCDVQLRAKLTEGQRELKLLIYPSPSHINQPSLIEKDLKKFVACLANGWICLR